MNKEELNKEIGAHLLALRKSKNITSKYIAEQLGISGATYRYVEAGKTELTYTRICQLSEILGVEMYEVIGYNQNDLCDGRTKDLQRQLTDSQNKVIELQDEMKKQTTHIQYLNRKYKTKP